MIRATSSRYIPVQLERISGAIYDAALHAAHSRVASHTMMVIEQ